ncbi:MAG: hypothetical protein JXE06_06190 [Coriobacteriia bacterium]|nr:hypothetical protein [Coriobacteriia bacterium]MBN2822331.1 hypothetical protein [Coriobacteriia bacterium]
MDNMGYGMPQQTMQPRNDPQYVSYLEQRIAALEARMPRTNVVSPKFWTRAWAIYGHLLALSLIVGAIVGTISLVLSLLGVALLAPVASGY